MTTKFFEVCLETTIEMWSWQTLQRKERGGCFDCKSEGEKNDVKQCRAADPNPEVRWPVTGRGLFGTGLALSPFYWLTHLVYCYARDWHRPRNTNTSPHSSLCKNCLAWHPVREIQRMGSAGVESKKKCLLSDFKYRREQCLVSVVEIFQANRFN